MTKVELMDAVTWTRFTDSGAANKREVAHEWRELVEHLRDAGPYAAKSLCPWIKLARFGSLRSRKNSLRTNANVLEITGVEGDYDGEKVQPEQALAMLERAGLRAIVYTSPSHKPEAPRWRVLAPLSQSMPPADRTRMLARVNGALGGILTGESFTLSQSYYYGRLMGQAEYKVLPTFDDPYEGACVDELDKLDEVAVISGSAASEDDEGAPATDCIAQKVAELGRALRTGDGRRNLLRSYIGDKSNRGLTAEEIAVLVKHSTDRYFDENDPLDWPNINALIAEITDKDRRAREEVDETVGEFVRHLADADPPNDASLVMPLAELDKMAAAARWTVKGILPSDSVGFLFGASGTFKSFVALDLGFHVAHGLQWLGRKTAAGPVVYTAAEGGSGVMRRIKAWHKHRKMEWQDAPFYVCPFPMLLGKPRHAGLFVEAIEKLQVAPALVVIDTMSQTFPGDENSAQEVAEYLRTIGGLIRAKFGCVVLIVHHSGHSTTERPRGSSAIMANVDFMYGVFRDEGEHLATLECVKVKDGDKPGQMTFSLDKVVLGKDEDGDEVSSLVASHLDQAAKIIAAAGAKSTSNRAKFLEVCRHGEYESAARDQFYNELGDAAVETKKKAWQRCMRWAVESGILDIVRGSIVVLKGQNDA